jgi:2-polyprenyl-3-methyl-5-hydroxy-6-metoxy-1,4-benzoquinol methylase
MNSAFDIGCDDGYLLNRLDTGVMRRDGCDPRLNNTSVSPKSRLLKGCFPGVVEAGQYQGAYDAIFALAVFEHFTEKDLIESSHRIAEMLSDRGRLIVTVPHPFVDTILDALKFLKLIDGQALEEHHGFDPQSLVVVLSETLRLQSKKTFQFGLNNLFVFEKK